MELVKISPFDQVFNLLYAGIKLGNPDFEKDFEFVLNDLLQQYDENDKDLLDAMLLQDFGQLSFFNCIENKDNLQTLLPDDETVCCDGVSLEAQTTKAEAYTGQTNLVVLKDTGHSDKSASVSVQISRAEHEISEILDLEPNENNRISQVSEENNIFNAFINKDTDTNKIAADSIEFDTAIIENDNLKATLNEEIQPKKQINNEIKPIDKLFNLSKVDLEGSINLKEADTEPEQGFTEEKAQRVLSDFPQTEKNQRVSDTKSEDQMKTFKIEETEANQITFHHTQNVDSEKFEIEQSKQIRPQEVFDQIVERIRYSVSNNIKELKVELKPEFLGKLDIKLIQDEDGIKAKIKVDSLHTENILKTEMAQLVDSLRDKNIDILNIDIQNNSPNHNASASGFNSFERESNSENKTKVKGSIKKKSPEINLQPTQSIISNAKIDCLV